MTDSPAASPAPNDPAGAGMSAGDSPTGNPLAGDSPGFLDEVASEASAESGEGNLTDAGASQDLTGPDIDPTAGSHGAG